MLASSFCQLACLLETKSTSINGALVAFLGGYKHNNFSYERVASTRGGILLIWNDDYVELRDIQASVLMKECATLFIITVLMANLVITANLPS